MSKHTPGPWVVDTTKSLGAYGVWTDYATQPGHDGAGYPTQIAGVIPNSPMPREQRDANARLIAAAPDLLEACKAVVAWFDDGFPKDTALSKARAAISKAEGVTV